MLSAELFREIRPEFLRLLGSPGARVYLDAADAIEVECGLRSGAVSRDEALALVERVLERSGEVTLEETDAEAAAAPATTLRDRARLVLERLVQAGWLEPDDRSDYQRFILPEPNASILLGSLREIARPGAAVFSDRLVAACNALRNRDAIHAEPWQTVETTLDSVLHGLRELKAVGKSVDRHTQRQVASQSLKENLSLVFDQYAEQIGHAAYAELVRARLPTRLPEAREAVYALQDDQELLGKMQAELLRREPALEPAAAMARVRNHLDELSQSLDRVVPSADDVDRRTAEFARKSLARFRYLQEVTGENRAAVQHFFEKLNEIFADRRLTDAEAEEAQVPPLLVQESKLLAGLESLYAPRLRAALGEVAPIDDDVDEEDLDRSQRQLASTLRNSLTVSRANRFATEAFARFGERIDSNTQGFLHTDDDLADLIACLLQQGAPEAKYRVEIERDLEEAAGDRRKHDLLLAGTTRVEKFTLVKK